MYNNKSKLLLLMKFFRKLEALLLRKFLLENCFLSRKQTKINAEMTMTDKSSVCLSLTPIS